MTHHTETDIAPIGKWTATSGKKPHLEMLFEENEDYYQSCSPCNPHNLFCQFPTEKFVKFVKIKVDVNLDTYYPESIKILGGSRFCFTVLSEWNLSTI